jgi:hypothetical protein
MPTKKPFKTPSQKEWVVQLEGKTCPNCGADRTNFDAATYEAIEGGGVQGTHICWSKECDGRTYCVVYKLTGYAL